MPTSIGMLRAGSRASAFLAPMRLPELPALPIGDASSQITARSSMNGAIGLPHILRDVSLSKASARADAAYFLA